MSSTSQTVLESLIDTVYDSVEGYRKAADVARSDQIRSVFETQRARRQQTLDSLNAELVRLGGSLVTHGTLSGSLHRVWVDITSLFGSDDKTAVERVEEGEDYLARKFEEALEHADLDPQTRSVIQSAYAEIRQDERLADRLSSGTPGSFGQI